MTFGTGAIATINLAALCDNYRLLAAKGVAHTCAAVVKANAYGLGVEKVAPALYTAGCRHFFVASIAEGVALRTLLPTAFIGMFHGVANSHEAALAIENALMPCLNSFEQIAVWQAAAQNCAEPLPAALHVDTGMNRLGLNVADAKTLAEQPEKLLGIEVLWLMSHLACAGTPEHPLNAYQLKQFSAVQKLFPDLPTSFANSAGIFLGKEYCGNLTRPGAALYGMNPTPHLPNPMNTVVTVTAPVLQVRTIADAQTVGYGATYTVAEGARLATVSCGYADALLRNMSNVTQAYVAGEHVPIAGIVSMDLVVLDISALPEGSVQAGDMVEFIGENISVDAAAEQAGTIGYEIFTNICPRVRKEYVS